MRSKSVKYRGIKIEMTTKIRISKGVCFSFKHRAKIGAKVKARKGGLQKKCWKCGRKQSNSLVIK